MKKSIIFVLFALAAVSCVTEKSELPVSEQEITFTASFESTGLTKSVLVDGRYIHWLPGDRISVSGAQEAFVSKAEEVSATTSFSGSAALSEMYYAVYPYEVVNSWIGNTAIVNLPTEQTAVKGTFADDLNVSTAATSSADLSLTFQNVLGHMKFSIDDLSGSITTVEIKTNGGESITGTASVSFDQATGKAAIIPVAQSSTITLTSDKALEPGDYYVAMIPGTYKSGLTLTFTDTNGAVAVKSVNDELVLDAGMIQHIGTVSGLIFEGGSTPPPSEDDEYINFLDQNTETLCVLNWDANGDNKLSYAEAAAVESIGTVFKGTNILSFDEFKYFTSVKRLDVEAFFECRQLRKLTLPESLEELGQFSLTRLSSLKELVIPASVKVMDNGLAAVCNTSLEKLVVEEGNTVYDSRNGCNAIIHTATNTLLAGSKNTVIPEDVQIIGYRAFMESGIENVVIPDSVREIGGQAFWSATPKTVVVGNGVETWGVNAFTYCTGDFTINSDLPDSNNGDDYLKASFILSNLTNVTFGPDITYIGSNSFPYCSYIRKVTVPKNVTHLGQDIFCKVRSVTELEIDCPVIGEKAFYNDCLTKVTIGDNVEVISISAFASCWELETVVMGDNVKTIDASAFSGAKQLKDITLSRSLEVIGIAAFSGCKSLISMVLPDKLEDLGERAFYGCSSLESVVLPDGLETVGPKAFYECSALSEVNFPSSLKYIKDLAFNSTALTDINLPNGLLEIGGSAFGGCSSVVSVYIPSSVIQFGERPFQSCTGELRTEILPANVSGSNGAVFAYADFSKIIIMEGVKEIPQSTFCECDCLTEVILPESMETIGEQAFYECTALKAINFPASLKCIEREAFYECESLESVTLPATLTSISERVFLYCSNLESVIIEEGMKELPSQLFAECSKLSQVTLPESLEKIHQCAFEDCDGLVEITIPENIKYMGSGIFKHADNLRTVYCKPFLPFEIDQGFLVMTGWHGRSFPDVSPDLTIYVPAPVVSDYQTEWTYYKDVIKPYNF